MPITDVCGTEAAYRRHLRAGETPCVPCREANSLARSERKRSHLDPAARERVERIRHQTNVAGLDAYLARRRRRLREHSAA